MRGSTVSYMIDWHKLSIGFHAFTGVDSVCAFPERGKTGPFQHLQKGKQAMGTFINLGM